MTDVRAAFHEVFAAIAAGELDRLDDLVDLHVVDHQRIWGQGDGLPGLKYWAGVLRTVIPDLGATVQDTVVEGDKVAGRVLFAGTLDAGRLPAAPTEPWVELEFFAFLTFRDGKVVEWWDASNTVELLRNLGVELVPPGG